MRSQASHRLGGLHIGLVNNMPDAALAATERQFRRLLAAAAGGLPVRVTLFALPDIPRSDEGKRRINRLYSSIDRLWEDRLDGLIVTGTEPRSPNLEEEPYWASLTRLVDWAEYNTASAIWSCLAAHAAVLHLDGIRRQRHDQRLFGVFESVKASDHPLIDGTSAHLHMPHSRWNGVSELDLARCGYRVLTRSERAGAELFVKRGRSLFVFFQGHPEYEARTLLLEYRRDIRRYLRAQRGANSAQPYGNGTPQTEAAQRASFCAGSAEGQTAVFPSTPFAYFGANCSALLQRIYCSDELLASFPFASLSAKVRNTWRRASVTIYRNWLCYLASQKDQRLEPGCQAGLALAERA